MTLEMHSWGLKVDDCAPRMRFGPGKRTSGVPKKAVHGIHTVGAKRKCKVASQEV